LQQRALQLFAFSVRDGGYLVLGKSETPGPLAEFFVPAHPQLKIYRRQGNRMLIPAARIKDTTPPFATCDQARTEAEKYLLA
jgi:two-component system CheB/CheR fusion protein